MTSVGFTVFDAIQRVSMYNHRNIDMVMELDLCLPRHCPVGEVKYPSHPQSVHSVLVFTQLYS